MARTEKTKEGKECARLFAELFDAQSELFQIVPLMIGARTCLDEAVNAPTGDDAQIFNLLAALSLLDEGEALHRRMARAGGGR